MLADAAWRHYFPNLLATFAGTGAGNIFATWPRVGGSLDALPDEPLKSAARLAKQSGQSLFNEYIWRGVRASFGKFRFDVREVRQETGKAALDNQQRKLWQAQGRIPELVRSRQDAADTLPPDVAGVLTSLAQNARSETVRLSADQLDAALKVLAEDKSPSGKPLTDHLRAMRRDVRTLGEVGRLLDPQQRPQPAAV